MRQPRIKVRSDRGAAVYHCLSRTVNGEFLLGDTEKEVLRKQLWQIADFCGVQVLTYALLSNHFHVLVRVPQSVPLGDRELLRRYQVLYPTPTRFQTAHLSVVRQQLAQNGPAALAWRKRLLALMGDVSQFMKLWKQRFTRWFNRTHARYGTLWAERFKSVLVEPTGHAALTVSAYLDLNSVRAGLAQDPLHYRFCGYAEAVGGSSQARAGLRSVTGSPDWPSAHARYRQWLFGTGSAPREGRHRLSQAQLDQVMHQQGMLPLHQLLRCRVRYFTDGAILGTHAFVAAQLADYRQRTGRTRTEPKALPTFLNCGDLAVLRALRSPAVMTAHVR